jgi:hypothetical protein
MSDIPINRDEINARLEVLELKTENKISRIDGKLDLISAKLDGENQRLDRVAIIGPCAPISG